jgi:protocatechuate 3,4-dioxygenase beta subunit
MLVDTINNDHSGATENTVLGPFYVANPPHYENGHNICLDGKGQPLLVRGRVLDVDGQPIAGATVDAWQTNEDGFYDVQQKGVQPDMNMRGVFESDAEGHVWFRTARPRYYAIPDDGPVGKMLRAVGRSPNRAAHLHLIVEKPGFETLITHIFEPHCPYLRQDTVFGVKDSLVGDFHRVEDPARGSPRADLQATIRCTNHTRPASTMRTLTPFAARGYHARLRTISSGGSSTASTSSCPPSTPRLKANSAAGSCARGSPSGSRPPAKAKPCTKPNGSVIIHRCRTDLANRFSAPM